MQPFAERSVEVNSTRVTVREATEADAEAMIAHRDIAWSEPHYFLWESDEFPEEPAGTRAWISGLRSLRIGLCLVLVAHEPTGDRVVGISDFRGVDRRRMRHRVEFGIGIQSAYRGLGLGTFVLEAMLSWAASHPDIEVVSLGCFDENVRAIELYERLGFEHEGRRTDAFVRDGRYHDEVLMFRRVKPKRGG
ncbi:MAG: GNAT family protein [Planctomycetota bacterium]